MRPELAERTGQRHQQRLFGGSLARLRRPFDQQQRHSVVQLDQRGKRQCVVEVEAMSFGQEFTPSLELPTVEIESAGREPLSAVRQSVVLDDLAQRRQRIGEQCGVRDTRGPGRRRDKGRFVARESRPAARPPSAAR